MRCPYEVLSVDQKVNEADLKKAYRKLALKYHPDKNRGEDAEKAHEIFSEIQSSYELLSDPQERAWFDSHRDAILRGGTGNEDFVDILEYFNASCFEGFDDSAKGFYTVYGALFSAITKEDKDFDSEVDYPAFGTSKSDYETCKIFYSFWGSYATTKTFSWCDRYDLRDAPNRQVRRLMEKENKKMRDPEKKEYNESVREVVSFVKRRDERMIAFVEIEKKLEKEKMEKRRDQRVKEREEQLEAARKFVPQPWQIASDDEEYSDDTEAEADVNEEDLTCFACNKTFSSIKTLTQHNRSKAHTKRIRQLEAEMADEDASFASGPTGGPVNDMEYLDDEEFETLQNELAAMTTKKKKKNKQKKVNIGLDLEEPSVSLDSKDILTNDEDNTSLIDVEKQTSAGSIENELAGLAPSKKKKRNQQKKMQTANHGNDGFGESSDKVDSNNNNNDAPASTRGKKNKKKNRRNNRHNDDDDDGFTNVMTNNIHANNDNDNNNNNSKTDLVDDGVESMDDDFDDRPKGKGKNKKKGLADDLLQCSVCDEIFTSRNKMFAHISETGHARPKIDQERGRKSKLPPRERKNMKKAASQ